MLKTQPILAELERLRQQWEKSVAQEMEKKNKIYLKALEKLQKKFTGANNLAAAVAVNDEIKMVRLLKPEQQRKSPLDGIWEGRGLLRIFNGDAMLDIDGSRYKCTFDGEDVTIYFSSRKGHCEKYTFNPDKPDFMEGVNALGNKVTLERVKW